MKDFYIKWLNGEVKENVVLSHSSALCFLYWKSTALWIEPTADEYRFDVYALEQGKYEDVNYHVVDSFDGIEIETQDNLRFTSFGQAVNDLLHQSADSRIRDDEESMLMMSLACYYILHGNSFDNLNIHQENISEFEKIKTSVLQKLQHFDDIEKRQAEKENAELSQQIKCETCLYASQCDGYEYAPYCMAEI